MAIKVLIFRHGAPERFEALKPLLQRLRTLALAQPGYISGETYSNLQNSSEYLVISTWASLEAWTTWHDHEERATVQSRVDKLLEEPTVYHVFQNA